MCVCARVCARVRVDVCVCVHVWAQLEEGAARIPEGLILR